MSREEHRGRERQNTGTPSPHDPEFTKWVEELWEDGQSPQKLELRLLRGKTTTEIKTVERYDCKPNQPAPNKEEVVRIANRFVAAAQREAEVAQQTCRFSVAAIDERRDGGGAYRRFPLRASPKTTEPEETERDPGDGLGSDSLLRRIDHIFEDDRWRQGFHNTATKDVLQMYQEENARLRANNNELFQRCMELAKQLEEAQSAKADRDLARDKQRFWLEKGGQIATQAMAVLPLAVNKIAGKPLMQAGRAPESLAIEAFLNGVPQEKKDKVFGKFEVQEVNGEKQAVCVAPGVLSFDQTLIFDGVAKGTLDPAALFELVEGGRCPILPNQLMSIRQEFGDEALMPLIILFKEMNEKRQSGA